MHRKEYSPYFYEVRLTELHTSTSADEVPTNEPAISCATERGIPVKYWSHFDVYELTSNDLKAKRTALRRWRGQASDTARFTNRVPDELLMLSLAHEQAQFLLDDIKMRHDALKADALLLHTPPTFRPSQENRQKVQQLAKELKTLDSALIWQADGLWDGTEDFIELCSDLGMIPSIDPLAWDEDLPLPIGQYHWRVMGQRGLSVRLGEYELDRLLDLIDQREAQGWIRFSSPHMYASARRWRDQFLR